MARGEGGGEAPEGGLAAAEVVPLRQRPSRPRPHREEEDSHVLREGLTLERRLGPEEARNK